MNHTTYNKILQRNGGKIILPLWKLNITEDEYSQLKAELRAAEYTGELHTYYREAALCYAEWWKREYESVFPSSERIAKSIGVRNSSDLYEVARKSIKLLGIDLIKHGRREFFRTLLYQGGLPEKYISSNWGSFTHFLEGAVDELSMLPAYRLNDEKVFDNLNCIDYLPESARNTSIYGISLQIVKAIINGDNNLLPYDIKNARYQNLGKQLRKVYERRKRQKSMSVSVDWSLYMSSN